MTRPQDCLYYLISRATLLATAALRRELTGAGVGKVRPAYLGVLMSLWQKDRLRTAVLGQRAGLEPSSMTGLLDRMERDGLIRRDPDPKDRRAYVISLTREGHEAERAVLTVVDSILAELTEGVTEDDVNTTKRTLQKVLKR